MDSIWLLYWITRFDAIQGAFLFIALLSGFCAVMAGFIWTLSVNYKPSNWLWSVLSVLFVVGVAGRTLTPSKEDALMITGGVVLTEIVQSEAAGRIASKSVLVVEKWLGNNIPKEEKKQ